MSGRVRDCTSFVKELWRGAAAHNRGFPALVEALALVRGHARLEAAFGAPEALHFARFFQKPVARPAR